MSQLYPDIPVPCSSLSPKLRTLLTEKTDRLLLRIIRANFNTQYASRAPSLAVFRDVIAGHGTEVDDTLLQDFRSHVALMDYESYKPFVARFNEQPCKESEVENLFAPGLPFALGLSSSTSGNPPKMFAKYHHIPKEVPVRRSVFDRCDVKGPENWMLSCGYKELKEVERECDQVVKRIPVGIASGALVRMGAGWSVDSDESRMSVIMPGQVSPWAACMINRHRSFLMIHALFCLACRDLDRFIATFAPLFIDLIRYVEEEWDTFLSCIKDGTILDLDGIDHVRTHLQVHFHPNPERAAELREIGSPFSCVGWAARVWPKLRMLVTISSGPFATALPKVRSILGPTIAMRGFGYGSTECVMGASYDMDDLDMFVIQTEDVIEFLHVAAEETHENILQAWDLEAGKQYQIVLTTRDGLWRYPLGDVIDIVGFDGDDGFPVIKYLGRKSLSIRLPHVLIPDNDLVAAIQAMSSGDIIRVNEFTAIVDDRTLPPTVGCFVEGELGPNSHLATQKLFSALVTINHKLQDVFDQGHTRLPTIRMVKPGTFMEYRLQRGEKVGVGAGQTKVPVVLLESAAQEWIKEKVFQEL
ncbi:hypothetical protein PAXINDRAFT_170699 [Paxillus involutus ATCC 200175]|uniref:GH3 middle domain-containing protein n=1 Tax=Paxillus involutus ATCC 200175 TaxID=664439 RepID=A0A0C9U0I0_PAXIN|nr:hypothetical protein PAXINDRAFT_170699 [Paxillus involutus ATCC 200175]